MSGSATKKNELFALVRSLQPTEKAFYKKMAKRHATSNQALHLQFFELIDKYPEKEEKFFFKQLELSSPSHYSGLKNYLWNDLLATLVFLKRKNPLIQLQNLDAEVEILLGKNLPDSVDKLLADAWELADNLDLYTEQQKILKHQFFLLFYSGIKQFKAASSRLMALQQTVLQRIQQEQQLRIYIRELAAIKQFTYLHLDEEELRKVKEIVAETKLLTVDPACSLLLIFKELVLATAFHLSYQFPESDLHAANLLRLWEMHSRLIRPNQILFLYSIDYSLYNAFTLKNLDLVHTYHEAYGLLAEKFMDKHALFQWEVASFNARLKLYHKRTQYDLVKQIMEEEAPRILDLARHKMTVSHAITIMSSCLISYFVLGEYKRSEDLLMDTKALNLFAGRDDVLYFITIFHMVLLYEMKKDLQLHMAIGASYARLYQKKKLNSFEKELMLFLKYLSNQPDPKRRILIIKEFLHKLDHYKNDPVKQLYFLYFNFYDWLQSKALQIPYTTHKKNLFEKSESPDHLSTPHA